MLGARGDFVRTLICFALALPSVAAAQTTVDFQIDDAQAQAMGFDPTEAEQAISSAATEALQIVDADAFMVSMAEAASLAGKGLGVDYASNPKQFAFGIGLSTAANANGFVLGRDDDTLPEAGFAAQTSAMAALNLGLLAGTADDDEMDLADRFVVSVHGLGFRSPFADRGFRGRMVNFGGHVTVKLIGNTSKGLLDWGGIDVTTGYEYSRYRLEFTGNTPFTTQTDAGELSWRASGRYELAAESSSIPLEISSNVRVSVVSVYLGVGFDMNAGKADGDGELSGPIEGTANGQTETLGSGSITSLASGNAEEWALRGFGGVQVNIFPLKIYAGLQGSSRASAAVQAGVRLAM